MSNSWALNGANTGNSLKDLLSCDEIVPGAEPSYQLCKLIYEYHPLGAKMADAPIRMAQSQGRKFSISVPCETKIIEKFINESKKLNCDDIILNVKRLSRIYGIASVALLVDQVDPNVPIDYKELQKKVIAFNVYDPLNTAGSLVLNLQPNDFNFLKAEDGITVQGVSYHPTRSLVVMNESPIYIGYTNSAFGYTGRSVYQRGLFPLKSFINSTITDDMVTRKAGVIIAKLKQPGSIIDNIMQTVAGIKRNILQQAQNNNVVSVGIDEEVESLDLQNISPAFGDARRNILENIAVSADMPAKLLNSETFAEGFGEGTEDAKNVARFVDNIRKELDILYKFFDKICMYRAWDEQFFIALKKEYPDEYGKMSYNEAFYMWTEKFTYKWPNLLTEPDSEKIRVEDVRLKAILALFEVLFPSIGPEEKAKLIEWACNNFNKNEMLFSTPIKLEAKDIVEFLKKQQKQEDESGKEDENKLKEPKPRRPFADSYDKSVSSLMELVEAKKIRSHTNAF